MLARKMFPPGGSAALVGKDVEDEIVSSLLARRCYEVNNNPRGTVCHDTPGCEIGRIW